MSLTKRIHVSWVSKNDADNELQDYDCANQVIDRSAEKGPLEQGRADTSRISKTENRINNTEGWSWRWTFGLRRVDGENRDYRVNLNKYDWGNW